MPLRIPLPDSSRFEKGLSSAVRLGNDIRNGLDRIFVRVRLLSEGKLLSLIERPGLLGSGLKWVVECGQVPVAT